MALWFMNYWECLSGSESLHWNTKGDKSVCWHISSFISDFHGYVSWSPEPDIQPQPHPKRAHVQPASAAVELCFRFCGKTSAFVCSLLPQPVCYGAGVTPFLLSLSTKVRDYSGTYTVKLIACTTAPHQEYSLPVICNPREPITFDLDIRFQQVAPQWYFLHVSFSF